MSSPGNHTPWESPWARPWISLLLALCIGCAAATAKSAGGVSSTPAPAPAPGSSTPNQSAALERYRRLVPYMTYYVAQGLTQGLAQRPPGLQALQALQPVHNTIEPFSPPGRHRGGSANGFLLPAYVLRPAPAPALGAAHGVTPAPPPQRPAAAAPAPPSRTLFRFDFQQQQGSRQRGVQERPFLPSPPLTPENSDSDDYFKPVTDTANYYRGAPAPAQTQHLVVFPDEDAQLRAKLRQQQRKQQQQSQQILLDDAYRHKQLMVQQEQLREQLRVHHQQDHEVRALVQAQQAQQAHQAKRLREQQLQAHLRAQHLKKLRAQQQRLQQDQELQAQLQEDLRQQQATRQQEADDLRAHSQLQEELRAQAQLQDDLRAQAQLQEDLRAQAQLQEDLRAQAQLQKDLRQQQAKRLKEGEEARAQVQRLRKLQRQQALREQQAQQALQEQQAEQALQEQKALQEHAPATAPASAPADTSTEVEQQVVVSLEEIQKMMPPSAPAPATAPATATAGEEPHAPVLTGTPDRTHTSPVVYAEDSSANPVAENTARPSSSRELVAHLINGLQLSNKLPQSLTPDNFDMSLKTILQLLKILHKTKTSTGPAATPARVKISPEAPERNTAFYIGGGTVSQTFPAPSVEGSTPGRPGIDYPAYDSIPQTSFSCATQRYKGFFGDPETNCQVWHYCDLNGGQASFLCPNGTIFSQVGLTCDWWFNVRCASTAQLYVLNERLYKYILPVKPSFPEDYSGPDVDRYLTEKFREMQAKARGRKEKLKMKENSGSQSTTEAPEHSDEPVETNQTEEHEVQDNKKPSEVQIVKVDERQQLDPDL